MSSIIYPGTFDPITRGHLDLIARAQKLFTKVIVAISASSKKNTLFSLAEREELIRQLLEDNPAIEICSFSGLLVELARAYQVMVVLRGLRAISDFEYELQLANLNRVIEPKFETVLLTPSEQYAYISASMVREIASLGGDVAPFVPPVVAQALQRKFTC